MSITLSFPSKYSRNSFPEFNSNHDFMSETWQYSTWKFYKPDTPTPLKDKEAHFQETNTMTHVLVKTFWLTPTHPIVWLYILFPQIHTQFIFHKITPSTHSAKMLRLSSEQEYEDGRWKTAFHVFFSLRLTVLLANTLTHLTLYTFQREEEKHHQEKIRNYWLIFRDFFFKAKCQ